MHAPPVHRSPLTPCLTHVASIGKASVLFELELGCWGWDSAQSTLPSPRPLDQL